MRSRAGLGAELFPLSLCSADHTPAPSPSSCCISRSITSESGALQRYGTPGRPTQPNHSLYEGLGFEKSRGASSPTVFFAPTHLAFPRLRLSGSLISLDSYQPTMLLKLVYSSLALAALVQAVALPGGGETSSTSPRMYRRR